MNKKTIIRMIFFALAIGILMGILCVAAGVITGNDQYGEFVFIGGILLIIVIGVVQILRMSAVNKKVGALTSLLTEEKEPKRYVEEMRLIIEQTKQKQQKDVLKINIATGLSQCGEFQSANDTLSEISIKKQPSINQIVCLNNMANNYFMMGDKEKAEKILTDHKKLFEQFESHHVIGANIMVTKTMKMIEEGEIEKAKSNLEQVDRKNISSYTNDLIDYLMAKIYFVLNSAKDGKDIIEGMRTRKLTPGIQMKIQELLQE